MTDRMIWNTGIVLAAIMIATTALLGAREDTSTQNSLIVANARLNEQLNYYKYALKSFHEGQFRLLHVEVEDQKKNVTVCFANRQMLVFVTGINGQIGEISAMKSNQWLSRTKGKGNELLANELLDQEVMRFVEDLQ